MENLVPPAAAAADDEISLLDLLLTVSQNIKLLILGPLAAGLCALGITFTLPATYESVAILPTDINSSLRLAAVLDPVVVKLELAKGQTPEEARLALSGRIKFAQDKQTKLFMLTVSGDSPQQAQVTAKALLMQIYEQSRPRGSNKTRLEVQLVGAKQRLEEAQRTSLGLLGVLERGLKSDAALKSTGSDVAKSYNDLLAVLAGTQAQVVSLELQLEGMSDEQLLQAPSLPEKPVSQKKAMKAAIAALATGFALLFFVFIRQGLRTAGADPESAAKLAAIRRALGFGGKTQP
jgi:LPS O-antigen subunit length determinant protein (WzzB/FepE family)